MSRSNTVTKFLGLCALVVGVMAIGATAAQAEETGGKWTFINGSGVLGELPEGQVISGKLEGASSTLLSEILKKKVEYTCNEFTVNEGKLIKGGTAKIQLTFHKCITKVGGVTQAACEPKAEGKSAGLIKAAKWVALLLLHKLADGTKDKVVIVHPEVGNVLANFEMGEECSIGEKVPVLGLLALVDCQNEGSVHKIEHLFTEFAPLTKLFTISETAEHKSSLDGSAFFFLNGANLGGKWATLWN